MSLSLGKGGGPGGRCREGRHPAITVLGVFKAEMSKDGRKYRDMLESWQIVMFSEFCFKLREADNQSLRDESKKGYMGRSEAQGESCAE